VRVRHPVRSAEAGSFVRAQAERTGGENIRQGAIYKRPLLEDLFARSRPVPLPTRPERTLQPHLVKWEVGEIPT
jgi:hypothetical protein